LLKQAVLEQILDQQVSFKPDFRGLYKTKLM